MSITEPVHRADPSRPRYLDPSVVNVRLCFGRGIKGPVSMLQVYRASIAG